MTQRRKLTDQAKQFLETGELQPSVPEDPPPTQEKPTSDLRGEILGDQPDQEASIRFTVDIPKSLHQRLQQLSFDSSKPKTELVRIIMRRALDDLGY